MGKGKVATKTYIGVKEENHILCITAMDEGEKFPHAPAALASRISSTSIE
jgi:hypothetical protein